VILPEQISKEPLGRSCFAVTTIGLRWCVGCTSPWSWRKRPASPAIMWRPPPARHKARPGAASPARISISPRLGVEGPGWCGVKAVGNYGEMYDRNVGSGSRLKLERGLNRLWKDGGLMYAPPIK